MALFFGNFVADEILDTKSVGCPVKMAKNASFPIWDSKSTTDDTGRETVVNSATSWIDGSAIYGPRAVVKYYILTDKNANGSLKYIYMQK